MSAGLLQASRVGLAGVLAALLGLGVAVFQADLRPGPPSAAVQLQERVAGKVAELVGVEHEVPSSADWVTRSYLALGLVALVAGVVSFLREENPRVAGTAGALGMIVVGWDFVLIGLAAATVIFLFALFRP